MSGVRYYSGPSRYSAGAGDDEEAAAAAAAPEGGCCSSTKLLRTSLDGEVHQTDNVHGQQILGSDSRNQFPDTLSCEQ